jgi:uncharacterized protein
MKEILLAVAAGIFGLIFGFGLIISHMSDPQRVADFLDVTGAWNPSLAFVMGAAIIVAAPAFAYARGGVRSALSDLIVLPDRWRIDARLIGGAAIFGLGWGLSGICPGPGLVLLAGLQAPALTFVGALIAGVLLIDTLAAQPAASASEAE